MKISRKDLTTMRSEMNKVAWKLSRVSRFVYFVGSRHNTNVERGAHINVLLVTDNPDWDDTDLNDNSIPWSVMSSNLEVTGDGKAAYDFWIYEIGTHGESHGELVCNAQAFFDRDGLERIEADGPVVWRRAAT